MPLEVYAIFLFFYGVNYTAWRVLRWTLQSLVPKPPVYKKGNY